jgi:hypothetical protein
MPPEMFAVITFVAKMVINVTWLLKPSGRRPNVRRPIAFRVCEKATAS